MPAAITIQQLSKRFNKAPSQQPYHSLRDAIANGLQRGWRKRKVEDFWALRDINLEIEQGERIGIVGRNGAGKSTLLKILSRISPPTSGRAIIEGRVASLLEVGTGFHPELTGRENIYLNGSILGLKRHEINRRMPEIIEFSGVADFMDTPLKHYSSGMQLRLAFSVAAHLEPEILMIDEVLAVGDLEFQRRCLGKMEEVSRSSGRTILFVSHNLEAVQKFCERSVLLDKGRLIKDAKTAAVISQYISQESGGAAVADWRDEETASDEGVKLRYVFAHDTAGNPKPNFSVTEAIGITLRYEVLQNNVQFTHGLNLYNERGVNIFDSHDNSTALRNEKRKRGTYTATVWIPPNLLPDGWFSIGVALFSQQPFHIYVHKLHVIGFTIMDEISEGSARGDYAGEYGGLVRPRLEWQATKTDEA